MTHTSKDAKAQIEEVRKRFGKPPLGKVKTYEQRLKEYEERELKKLKINVII